MDFDTLKEQYIEVNCNTGTYTKEHGLDSYEYLKEVPRETKYDWMIESIHRKLDTLKNTNDVTSIITDLIVLLEKVKGQDRYTLAEQAVEIVLNKENFYFIDRARVKQILDNLIDQKLRNVLDDITL